MYKYVDKILARQYIAEWIGEEYLPKLYGVWDKFDDINFNSLPDKFALKTNHGCGNHYFCSDKSKLDIEEARKTINKALNNRFHNSPEQQYELIEPKIFCEELIEIEGKEQPEDYKFMCCDGEIKCILICLERKKGLKLAFYDLNWNKLDYARGPEKYYGEVSRPKHLEEMIDIAKKIASNFEYIRIDMYDTGSRIYIGELTFTPEGGKLSYMTNEAVRKCGHAQS